MKQLLDEYKTLKGQKQFFKIIYANIVNRFGDSIDAIAFTWLVYEITGDPAWSAIIFGMNMVPTILIQPFAGALVEKMKKRRVMMLCDIARGILVSFIAIAYFMSILKPWMLLTITLLNSTVEALRVPAGSAIVPHILEKEHYDKGIALNSTLSRAMELIGTGCAGVIIGLFGITTAILIDALTFVLSAIIIASIRYNEQIENVKISMASYLNTLKEGILYIRKKEIIIILCIIACFLNFMIVPVNSFMPIYIDKFLKGGSETLSMLTIGLTIGSFIGSFFFPIISKRIKQRTFMILTTAYVPFFYGLSILVPQYIPFPIVFINGFIFVLYLLLGFTASAASTFLSVTVTTQVDRDYLARTTAVFGAVATLMIPVGSLIVTFLLQFFDFVQISLLFGVMSFLLSIIYSIQKKFYLLNKKEV